ncbi:hypothetical protein [Sphingosinicella sp. YJ22]|uniref:hypothetical protein n=1 Tax=Sphingosinicella sp. YJ22 TaxID=1104780 RepID=UPI00140D0D09|nr:hypothetical protein [Sphingosinicella sp. YJ22]
MTAACHVGDEVADFLGGGGIFGDHHRSNRDRRRDRPGGACVHQHHRGEKHFTWHPFDPVRLSSLIDLSAMAWQAGSARS